MSGSFNNRGELEFSDGLMILCVGKKKSGKSVMGKLLFAFYPDDRIVIDMAGDDGPVGGDIIEISGNVDELPTSWPEHRRQDKKPMTLRYVPNFKSPTWREDIDAVVGLALAHGTTRRAAGGLGCCVLIHEIGRAAPVAHNLPNITTVLNQNRHNAITMIMCGPRPMNIDPLCLQQADLVYVFELPNKTDRARLGEQVGWDVDELTAAVRRLGPHEYLLFDGNEAKPVEGEEDQRLKHFDALPPEVVKAVQAAK